MLRIRNFQGLRPAPELAAEVACVPYDVVSSAEAAALAENNPHSLLHVDRAEIDCPPDTDPHSDLVYATAVGNFRRLQEAGSLIREEVPALYVYRLQMDEHQQTGLVAVCHIEDYENDLIKKHEKTRRDKEDDRTRLVGDLSANTGPIFLTYKDHGVVDRLIAEVISSEPINHFTAPDGVIHSVWRIAGGEALIDAFHSIPCAYVADGHHRTASAVRVGRDRRQDNPNHTGEEDYNWFLSVLFPASQLKILPYNRLVDGLEGKTPDELLSALSQICKVHAQKGPVPPGPGWVAMALEGSWFHLEIPPRPDADPVSALDVSWLQDQVLAPLLGVADPRTSQKIEFIGGIRGTDVLLKQATPGSGKVAFSLAPTTVNQLMEIADAGQIMPPKSTWFEPKLRSGLFIHTF